ncbi:DUF5615 family PIN-like protein [Sorangium sp. So ce764]|uniref:DUF5615 family PIN-like protein n=1 Tax=unclassified Sorangium TaxID=2621164 RepID=UPI003F5DD1E1
MRIKLDENLPTSLVDALVQLGHDADSVQQEGLQGSPDSGVWAAAQVDKPFSDHAGSRFLGGAAVRPWNALRGPARPPR